MFSIRFPLSICRAVYLSFAENLYPMMKHCYPKDNASVDRAQVVIELFGEYKNDGNHMLWHFQ